MIDKYKKMYSAEEILSLSNGEVTSEKLYEDIWHNRIDQEGLLSQRIFGPAFDYTCECGLYEFVDDYKRGLICERCGTPLISSDSRNYRIGHIKLIYPVIFEEYYEDIQLALDINPNVFQNIINFYSYLIIDHKNLTEIKDLQIISQQENSFLKSKYGNSSFISESGNYAILYLLKKFDISFNDIIKELETRQKGKLFNDPNVEKRMKLAGNIYKNKIKLENAVLEVLPVIPVNYRDFNGIKDGSNDSINDLYIEIIRINNKIKRCYMSSMGESIKMNQIMLQNAVNRLLKKEEVCNYIFCDSNNTNSSDFIVINNVLQKYVGNNRNVILPNGIKKIGSNSFANCEFLTSIILSDSIEIIDTYAFNNCKLLTSITLGKNVKKIEASAFEGCHKLVEVINKSNLILTAGHIDNGWLCSAAKQVIFDEEDSRLSLINSDYYIYTSGDDKLLVNYVGDNSEIIIPDCVTSIDRLSFSGCTFIRKVSVSNNVKEINYGAFSGCSSLTNIVIPDSVISIGNGVFSGCSSLTNIVIPDSVISIGDEVFSGCSSLTNIVIPDSVISIGDEAFVDCENLNYNLFKDCYYLGNDDNKYLALIEPKNRNCESYLINDRTKIICGKAFSDCEYLKSINVPPSVLTIGTSAFSRCSSLESVTIPNSVTSIGFSAFSHCSSLKSITIPNSITTIDNDTFSDCSSLSSIIIPNSVTNIGAFAFSFCQSLESFVFPNRVERIGSSAFACCSRLDRIIIPKSVAFIGDNAFYECYHISIYCEAPEKPNEWDEKWDLMSNIGFYHDIVWDYKRK